MKRCGWRAAMYTAVSFFIVLTIFSSGLWAAPYYQGKKIKIIVGGPPGSGFDNVSRLLAKHLPKHIPGNPKIIIEHQPTASSMVAANYLYNVNRPDGFTFGTINPGLALGQLIKIEGIKFDFSQFTWLGSISSEITLLCVRRNLPYKTFDEFRKVKEKIPIAGAGPASRSTQFSILAENFLSQNIKIIYYAGTPPTGLVVKVESGETDGTATAYSFLKPAIDRGMLKPILRGRNSNPATKNLPVDEDLTTDKIGKQLMAIRSIMDNLSRPFVAPPGMRKETADILRKAFDETSKDPLFLKDAERQGTPVEYTSAERSLSEIKRILNQPPEVIEGVKKYLKF